MLRFSISMGETLIQTQFNTSLSAGSVVDWQEQQKSRKGTMTARSARFVILEHSHPFVHWDFMFEEGDSLYSWRLLKKPVMKAWIKAERLPNHRRVYLDYEGPVSGDRGEVTRWEFGTCQIQEVRNERVSLRLNGSRWEADMRLERITANGEEWRAWLSTTQNR